MNDDRDMHRTEIDQTPEPLVMSLRSNTKDRTFVHACPTLLFDAFLSVLVPEDGFLLGCVFAIADYSEQLADKQLLATWKRVRESFKVYFGTG